MSEQKENKGDAGRRDSNDDDILEATLESLADLVVLEAKESYHSELEPFDSYARRLRARMISEFKTFRQRFANGYKVLYEGIRRESENGEYRDG
ncbi:MAG: hypothetical protein KDK40_05330 [Chlamydiia bacterium]|nr:hypothetical protein [Chlamydiia bacterium]